MWYVYILQCSDDSLYTGITKDVATRFKQHANGTGGRYTRSHTPVRILYTEVQSTKSTALSREYEIKQLRRVEKEILIQQYRDKLR